MKNRKKRKVETTEKRWSGVAWIREIFLLGGIFRVETEFSRWLVYTERNRRKDRSKPDSLRVNSSDSIATRVSIGEQCISRTDEILFKMVYRQE